jgi:hypothetical protein
MVAKILETLRAARERLRFRNADGRELTLMTGAYVVTCTSGSCGGAYAVLVSPTTAGTEICHWCGGVTRGEWQRISAVLERLQS